MGDYISDLYTVRDPRPIAASAPYTFFLPAQALVEAVNAGDLVQAIFTAIPPSEEYDAERMWVRIHSFDSEFLEGALVSEAFDMPKLPPGSNIRLPKSHVVDVLLEDQEKDKSLRTKNRRDYWERCLVDQCVLDGDLKVGFLYREEPDMGDENDKYLDSGWRIRGDLRGQSSAELENRELAYVALGAVLNQDDSWLHLIDEPIGVAFEKDFDIDDFVLDES